MNHNTSWNPFIGIGPSAQRKIQTLSKDLQELVNSKVKGTITTPLQCIEELVLNSIDANAQVILVTIDPEKNKIIVDDNGIGMNKKDFEVIGTRFCTSKCFDIADLRRQRYYGFRGESLKEILDVTNGVEMYTRPGSTGEPHTNQGPYYRKFKNGKPVGSVHTVLDSKRPIPGLKIVVHGLLQNVSVQELNLMLDNIRKLLERIHFMNPRVTLQLKNGQNNKILLDTQQALSTLEAFKGLYMSSLGKSNTLREVFHMFDVYFCSGWFSIEAHRSKRLQMVYLNKRPLQRNTLHRSLNEQIMKILSPKVVSNPTTSYPEKYAIFMVNISCDLEEVTITRGPTDTSVKFKDMNLVIKAMDGLVQAFKGEIENGQKNVPSTRKFSIYDQTCKSEMNGFQEEVTTHQFKRAVHSRNAVRPDELGSPKFDSDIPDTPNGKRDNVSIGSNSSLSSLGSNSPSPDYSLAPIYNKNRNLANVNYKPLQRLDSLKRKNDDRGDLFKQMGVRMNSKEQIKDKKILQNEAGKNYEAKNEVHFDSDVDDTPPERNSPEDPYHYNVAHSGMFSRGTLPKKDSRTSYGPLHGKARYDNSTQEPPSRYPPQRPKLKAQFKNRRRI